MAQWMAQWMIGLKRFGVVLFAAVSWILTVFLVNQLLGGVFDARACTTECVRTLYWVTFAVTVLGVAYGIFRIRSRYGGAECEGGAVADIAGLSALSGLLLIFLVMMAIGTFA